MLHPVSFHFKVAQVLSSDPLWLRGLGETMPRTINGRVPDIWQYTMSGRVPGIDGRVDMNRVPDRPPG